MSLWGVHIGIAVIITTLIVGYLRLPRSDRWVLIGISGVFATVPDWYWLFTERFFPGVHVPWFARAYSEMLHESWLADLFWFHGVIDTVGADDQLSSVLVAASSVVVFLTVEYKLSRGNQPE